jgi:crossover junction endodeoxyribonuclease RuvC
VVIVGIDPGSVRAGLASLKLAGPTEGRAVQVLDASVFTMRGDGLAERLAYLHRCIVDYLAEQGASMVWVEVPFAGRNYHSFRVLSECLGVIRVATWNVTRSSLREVSPAQAKQFVTGSGAATKLAVARAIAVRLGISYSAHLEGEAGDALAVAYYGAASGDDGLRARQQARNRSRGKAG